MADDTTPPTALTIPDDLRARFPELIDLIIGSQSMNDGERQYWVNLLPIMTQDQIANLKSILENERSQLAAIDAQYASTGGGTRGLQDIEQERKARSDARKEKESEARRKEEADTAALLTDIESHES